MILASGASLNEPEMLINMDSIKEARQLCDAMDGCLNIVQDYDSKDIAVSIEFDLGLQKNF